MLPIGTKVRRGPKWTWHNQDKENGGSGVGIVKEYDPNWGYEYVVWWLKEDGSRATSYCYNLCHLEEIVTPKTEGMRLFDFLFTSEHERAKLNPQPLPPMRDFFDNLPDAED